MEAKAKGRRPRDECRGMKAEGRRLSCRGRGAGAEGGRCQGAEAEAEGRRRRRRRRGAGEGAERWKVGKAEPEEPRAGGAEGLRA